jgi:cytochrome c5
MFRSLLAVCVAGVGTQSLAADKPANGAVERGREAVRGRPALNPAVGNTEAYNSLWKQWGLTAKPADYDRMLRERYGLHAATYPNDGLPMGVHPANNFLLGKGVATDCLLCHAGTVAGQPIIGLANANLDIQSWFEDLFAAGRMKIDLPFQAAYVRGTIDPVSPFTFLLSHRDADLNLREPLPADYFTGICSDPPAWWLLKKKKTRDWNGGVDARTVRLDMATILSPLNSGAFVKKQEPVFTDIHAFVMQVEPPKYPFPVDVSLAARGAAIYTETCATCHGKDGTYPNKIIAVEKLGTDPMLATSFSKRNFDHVNTTWLTAEKGPDGKPFHVIDTRGYQAPPLDGVWATAPYFHNGSVPTLYHVLNSAARPTRFTRSYRSEKDDYDPVRVGLKVTPLSVAPSASATGFERRKVYDTTIPGRGNAGHTYGDKFTEDERTALIEYLKTL